MDPANGKQDAKMFNDDDYISTYTDQQAIEDGVLVAVQAWGLSFNGTVIDRMTTTLYEHMLGMANGEENKLDFIKHLIEKGLTGAYDPDGDGYLIVIPGNQTEVKMWLVQNERGNYTLMFPSDY